MSTSNLPTFSRMTTITFLIPVHSLLLVGCSDIFFYIFVFFEIYYVVLDSITVDQNNITVDVKF